MSNNKHFETMAIRTQAERTAFKEHAVPLYMTSSYRFDSAEEMRALFAGEAEGNIYSRYSNPNTTELIDKLCLLEGTEAGWATASGMAAVFTSFAALLEAGDHIVSSRSVFGSTHQLLTQVLPKWGIQSSYVDIRAAEAEWEAAVQPNTRLIYVETPSNPAVDLIDLEWLGAFARAKGLYLLVDNCFASPYLQQPGRWGADLVIHSATKYIDGQGRTLGGLILGSEALIQRIESFARHTGPALSPFNAWILSKSLETLAVRMERHCGNALALAERLEAHPGVKRVRYPFLDSHPQQAIARKQMRLGGGICAFDIRGGLAAGRQFLDALKMFSLTANLGDTRSIATHPASTTHAKLQPEQRAAVGIGDGLIRLSAGLEHIEDIWADVEQALATVG